MGYDDLEHHVAKCLECGDEIVYGRRGRKFCCSVCKNRFNNRKAKDSRKAKTRIQNALERNYAILGRLLRSGRTSIDVSELRQLGFNFGYVTSYHKTRRHDEFGCFDISFIVMSSKVIEITRIATLFNLPDECQKNH